jgi:hypothetical protein
MDGAADKIVSWRSTQIVLGAKRESAWVRLTAIRNAVVQQLLQWNANADSPTLRTRICLLFTTDRSESFNP